MTRFTQYSDSPHHAVNLTVGSQYVFRVAQTGDTATGDTPIWSEWSGAITVQAVDTEFTPDGDLDLGTGKILYSNVYGTLNDLPAAADYHGMFAHVHNADGLGTGAAFYAHAGNWVRLADNADLPASFVQAVNGLSGAVTIAGDSGITVSQTGNQLTLRSTQTFTTLNGESGALTLTAGDNIEVLSQDGIITVSATNHSTVNNISGDVSVVAGQNINVTTSGQNIVISGEQGGLQWVSPAPSSSSDPGNAGDMAYSGNYLFLHNGVQWNRVLLSSFASSSSNSTATRRILSESSDQLMAENGSYLNVDETLAFSTQPANQTATNDISLDSLTLSSLATHSTGAAVTYQWQKDERDAGDNWQDIAGETAANLSLSLYQGDDQSRYRVLASAGGLVAASSAATMTVETKWVEPGAFAGFSAGEVVWVYGTLPETVVSSGSPYIMIPTPNAADGSLVYRDSSGNPKSTQLSGEQITKIALYKDGVLQKEDNNLYTGKIIYDGSAYQFELIGGSTLSGSTLPPGDYRVVFRLRANTPDGSTTIGSNVDISTRVFTVE